jgi:hypothetical protein
VVDVGDDAEVPNLGRRCERLVGETADGGLLLKPGLGASRVSADGRCSTIAARAESARSIGASRGWDFAAASATGVMSKADESVSIRKVSFSDEISLSTVVVRSSADESGANASAAPTAKPPTTAILPMFIALPFTISAGDRLRTAGGHPARLLKTWKEPHKEVGSR